MSTTTCSITIIATNNTGQGPITFGSLDFMSNGTLEPVGYPPIVIPALMPGDTQTILTAIFDLQTQGNPIDGGPMPLNSYCAGTAIFNLPDGDQLTIVWDLNANDYDNSMPNITAGTNYNVGGITSPVSDGRNFTFTLNIQSQ